jgi:predicted ATP-binding protein involved in virulence
MNINRLTLKNFRNIIDETFVFDSSFTVIIGVNGKGKSSILFGLRVACGAFFLGIPEVKKRHIIESDIRLKDLGKFLVPQKPVKIEAEGYFEGKIKDTIIWKRQILEDSKSTTSSDADVGNIRKIGKEKYQQIIVQENDEVALPVIAFFGTSRIHGAGRNRESRTGRQIFKEGYQDWIEMKATTFKYEDWLSSYEFLRKSNREYSNTKQAFFDTIKRANPYITEIEEQAGKLWIKVQIDDYVSDLLPLELHSDGIRSFTEMVAELSYRCVILNGFLDDKAVEQSRGIVLIDEIDLHLHPTWQRHVIADLKKAFPNIQFIATTHSPFIVQSLGANELINLDNPDVTIIPDELPLNKVITDIMGVDNIRSDDFENRYQNAKEELEKIDNKELTLDDYQHISSLLGKIIKDEVNDPIYKAFLEAQEENETD